jgi:hypothetical protein
MTSLDMSLQGIKPEEKKIRDDITPQNHTTKASRDTSFNDSTYSLSNGAGTADGPLEAAIHPRIEELRDKYIFFYFNQTKESSKHKGRGHAQLPSSTRDEGKKDSLRRVLSRRRRLLEVAAYVGKYIKDRPLF